MSNQIIVDVDKVKKIASHIATCNNAIKTGFGDMEKRVNSLNSNWDSAVADAVITKFFSIKNDFYSNRYKVVENFTNVLNQQISDGYRQTEVENVSLADLFK